ncbi:hypothetical protein T265_08811 [Opisthorchis viverrini]|uniref:Uncharacterized protein n=1 Tax=Opisthorchis viverrini TaxID=6198 RepID=A0A074ZCF4_OPIVI|nr:hypothetical protein T265_08811 [Opisthorchis viverrini]KER23277.1 hypothetical protein T265_08811 [Opisthorchis viverrini]
MTRKARQNPTKPVSGNSTAQGPLLRLSHTKTDARSRQDSPLNLQLLTRPQPEKLQLVATAVESRPPTTKPPSMPKAKRHYRVPAHTALLSLNLNSSHIRHLKDFPPYQLGRLADGLERRGKRLNWRSSY